MASLYNEQKKRPNNDLQQKKRPNNDLPHPCPRQDKKLRQLDKGIKQLSQKLVQLGAEVFDLALTTDGDDGDVDISASLPSVMVEEGDATPPAAAASATATASSSSSAIKSNNTHCNICEHCRIHNLGPKVIDLTESTDDEEDVTMGVSLDSELTTFQQDGDENDENWKGLTFYRLDGSQYDARAYSQQLNDISCFLGLL